MPFFRPKEAPFRPRFHRFECKYVIDEGRAAAIRRFISPYVHVDPHAGDSFDRGYTITSLYLDAQNLRLFWESQEGLKDRIKLRIRSYNGNTDDPAYLEIKRRQNRLVNKGRARLDQDSVTAMLAGGAPDTSHLVGEEMACYEEFLSWIGRWATLPVVWVKYRREAYVGAFNPGIRVTFDRNLACAPASTGSEAWAALKNDMLTPSWRSLETHRVVLELKFNMAFPGWMHDLVQQFDLSQRSYSKYCNAVRGAVDSWRLSANEAWALPYKQG